MYRNGCGPDRSGQHNRDDRIHRSRNRCSGFPEWIRSTRGKQFFGASFIVFRVIGIDSVNNVGGTDDKIKRMSGHRFAVDFRDVGLQTDFDSKTNGKTVMAGVLKTADFFYIGIKIQKKQIGIIRVIIIK